MSFLLHPLVVATIVLLWTLVLLWNHHMGVGYKIALTAPRFALAFYYLLFAFFDFPADMRGVLVRDTLALLALTDTVIILMISRRKEWISFQP